MVSTEPTTFHTLKATAVLPSNACFAFSARVCTARPRFSAVFSNQTHSQGNVYVGMAFRVR